MADKSGISNADVESEPLSRDSMVMTRRDLLAIGIGLVASPALVSCGTGSANRGGEGPVRGFGSVSGRLYRNAGGTLGFSYGPTLPAGASPEAGAGITVAGSGSTAKSAADGSFTVNGVPTGLSTVTAKSKTDSLQTPITVIDQATIVLGPPAVSRQQAVDAAKVEIAKVADVTLVDILAAQQPLPAGVKILAALDLNLDPGVRPAPIKFASPQWFVYADLMPAARWQHDVLYVFIDVATGAVTTRQATSWPTLNNRQYYGEAVANRTNPDLVSASRAVSKSVGVMQIPTMPAVQRTRDHTDAETCKNAKTWAILVRGDVGCGMEFDVPRVKAIIGSDPFPQAAHIYELICPNDPNPHLILRNYVNDVVKNAQPCDYVFLYITSHGSSPPHYFSLNAGPVPGSNGTSNQLYFIYPDQFFDFSDCKACHFVIMIDTCYSGNWIPLMQDQFKNMNGREVVILTAADQNHVAWGRTQQQSFAFNGRTVTVPQGGLFTSAVLDAGPTAFTTPQLYTDLGSAYGLSVPYVNAANHNKNEAPQSPQQWTRTLLDGETCDCGNGVISVK